MYSKCEPFQIHQQKGEESRGTRENTLSILCFDCALKIASVAYNHGQIVDTKLTNQSARFTQVVL